MILWLLCSCGSPKVVLDEQLDTEPVEQDTGVDERSGLEVD